MKMLKPKHYKPKKAICRQCGEDYIRERAFTVCCSIPCALKYARKRSESETKKKRTLALKEYRSSDKSHLMKIAQKEVNRFINLRDKHLPCISCGREVGYRQEAGHYMSKGGNGHIRFDEKNINSQCHVCNCHQSANLIKYRENLILKIGLKEVERLETKTVKRWEVEELKEIIEKYREKIKKIEGKQ